jgi:hypothetical protein
VLVVDAFTFVHRLLTPGITGFQKIAEPTLILAEIPEIDSI